MSVQKHLVSIIEKYNTPIGKAALEDLLAGISEETIAKGTIFIEANKTNYTEYFLLSGICRSVVQNEHGENVSIAFFQNEAVLTPHVIRTVNNVSNLSFEALTDCKMATLKSDFLLNLMIENIEIRNFANAVLKAELIQKVQKEIHIASLSAKAHLLALRHTYPNIENHIPHEMIASYLGITRISLSRLRTEISRGD